MSGTSQRPADAPVALPCPFPAAILFDFGGTLDADGLPAVTQFLDAYQALGGYHNVDTFAAAFRESDRRLGVFPGVAQLGFGATVDAQARLLAELLAEYGVDWGAVAAQVAAAARATAARNRPVLQTLRVAGARLGVVSNFTGNVDRCLAELGLLDLFDVVIDSAIVGCAKPEPRVFRLALGALGTPPERALMVGDNPFADVRAAAALGMATCWLAPAARAVPDGCVPTVRVARLPELLAALDLAS